MHFWIYGVEQKIRSCFRLLPSYGRFVALMPRLFIPFCILVHSLRDESTGIYIADSTRLAVCGTLRINRNRVFKGAWPDAAGPPQAGSATSICTS